MISFRAIRYGKSLALTGLLFLSACAAYHPVALAPTPDLAAVPSLTVPASRFRLPGLEPRPFPRNGLDETAVITLAVYDNPALKAARLEEGVARAQLLEAGLLPDPQFSADFARSAFDYGGDIGLSQDIRALITRGAAKAAARAHVRQIHLDILWQEWQVAEKARELFIQTRADGRLHRLLSATHSLLDRQYELDERALARRELTLAVVDADLARLTDSETSLRQLALDSARTRQQLNQLLGLRPEVRLRLIGPTSFPEITRAEFRGDLAGLARRRPDLLALEAGYAAQEQSVRRAILAQFPSLRVGLVFSRDPAEGVNDFGPSVRLSLPIFNRNHGRIAIERATRAVLRQTYQARLDQATGNASEVWKTTAILRGELRELDVRLSALRRTAKAAEKSLRQGNLRAAVYVGIESTLLAWQAEAIRLRASLANSESALRTLLGLPFRAP